MGGERFASASGRPGGASSQSSWRMPGEREVDHMSFEARRRLGQCVAALFLLLVLAGAPAPALAAGAGAGPFLLQRETGSKGEGESMSEGPPEVVQGEGGEQKLTGTVLGEKVSITVKGVQVKGLVHGKPLQEQVKVALKFSEPKLTKPELKECEVKIGEENTVHVLGYLAWTWNGESKQLSEKAQPNQKPVWIFLPSELAEGANSLPKGKFATVTLKTGCGALAGSYSIEGSEVGELKPEKTEEWASAQTISTSEGKKKQHFWNGKKAVGVEAGLTLAGGAGAMVGSFKVSVSGKEVEMVETHGDPPYDQYMLTSGSSIVGTRQVIPKDVFKTSEGEIKCPNVEFEGHVQGSESMTIEGTFIYNTCEGGTVKNGCEYIFWAPKDSIFGGGEPPAADALHESLGGWGENAFCAISLEISICKMHIETAFNEALPLVKYENGLPFVAIIENKGITYSRESSCAGKTPEKNGVYEATQAMLTNVESEVKIN
jgi:hypothetical protein